MDPRQRNLLSMAAVLVLAALAWWQFWPPGEKITQGLDIQGGLSVILTAVETPETPVTDDVMDRAELIVRNRVDRLGASEVTIQRQGSDSILVQLPGIANAQEALDALGSTGQLEIRDVVSSDPTTGEVVLGEVLLTGDVITAASIGTNPQTNEIEVNVTFDSEGAAAWSEITGARIGQQIAIVLDGNIESAPVVRDRITGGQTTISGNFTPEEARRLKTVLETGALPVSLEFSESRVVGPTLGQDSLRKGVFAALAGLGLVALYLAAYYRGFGVASWFALSIFGSLFLGVLSLLSNFGWFALSLPGIAGIVLTIGLAADSEILMIERFKEEVRGGKTYRSAARHGTRHAIGTSLDADLVTFVSALMLYTFAIGPVRGFALTLMLGLAIDILNMVFWSRSVIITLAETVVPRVPWLFGVKGGGADA
ncbi:MAG: protein translocase subunit SecD [Anaerosomatales bacterium]|nr:protein translocase subunit SecD [Anaerosomatales bacterium]MDT8433172.1 protein translocase subunit SecD [Anaerosomatales bacterium]